MFYDCCQAGEEQRSKFLETCLGYLLHSRVPVFVVRFHGLDLACFNTQRFGVHIFGIAQRECTRASREIYKNDVFSTFSRYYSLTLPRMSKSWYGTDVLRGMQKLDTRIILLQNIYRKRKAEAFKKTE